MKKIYILIGILFVAALSVVLLYPVYKANKDSLIVDNLEERIIPILTKSEIGLFSSSEGCYRIRYGTIEAASPQGCAYIENVTDPRFKTTPDFTDSDRAVFDELSDALRKMPYENIVSIGNEYTLWDRPEHAFTSRDSIGLAFHVACFFCRTRYVYSPAYKELPPNIEEEIFYIPINRNWFRVEQDWN